MKFFKSLYCWILLACIAGGGLGVLYPQLALQMEPLGLNFVKLIKLFIGPIVFLTVATGIAETGSLKKLGSIGLKTIIYFEVVSTIALLIGWAAAVLIKPGSLLHADVTTLDASSVQHFIQIAEQHSFIDFLQNLIPASVIEPFAKGDILQILILAVLFGIAVIMSGEKVTHSLLQLMNHLTQVMFKIIRIVMYAAPIGVFGAMAFTIAKFGSHFLIPLLGLIGTFYLTAIIFVFGILGLVARVCGFSLLSFLKLMSPELLLVLGTSSSESALPQLLQKLEKIGCQRETVAVVVPIGYSFNLDGTNIYITLAALFIAQALGIELTFTEQLTMFATAMLSSKGAAGVTGAGFITLAATLAVVPTIPAVGIVLILGIDRFMSEARAVVNYIGNGVAALAISRWQKEISAAQLRSGIEKTAIEL